jgi:hypothetical protein
MDALRAIADRRANDRYILMGNCSCCCSWVSKRTDVDRMIWVSYRRFESNGQRDIQRLRWQKIIERAFWSGLWFVAEPTLLSGKCELRFCPGEESSNVSSDIKGRELQ